MTVKVHRERHKVEEAIRKSLRDSNHEVEVFQSSVFLTTALLNGCGLVNMVVFDNTPYDKTQKTRSGEASE